MSRQPSVATVKRLYAASGGVCAFPGCPTTLVDGRTGALLGEMCHIHAASAGGPRYDPGQTEALRNDVDNLIILCPTHHSLIDQAPAMYTAATLREMKLQHEQEVAARMKPTGPPLGEQGAIDFARQVAGDSVDFAIIVALDEELDALLRYFPELKKVAASRNSTRSYYVGIIGTAHGGSYRVVATSLSAIGNLEAAHATADLLHQWRPRFVVVTGIAAGLSRSEQDFGDIVVSDAIVSSDLRKITNEGTEIRWRLFPGDPNLLAGIHGLDDSRWRFCLPSRPDGKQPSRAIPAVHVGRVVSSDTVVNAASDFHYLKSIHPKLIAVEMESAGIVSMAFSALKQVGFITVRALSDFADTAKDNRWRSYAAAAAAAFLRTLLESRPVAPSEGDWPRDIAPSSPARNSVTAGRRKQLFDHLCTALDQEEFRTFCFLIGVDIDELPGDRKSAKVRELILLFERRNEIATLVEAVADLRGDDGA